MCNFVCGTVSHAKSPLHWSVIHYRDNPGTEYHERKYFIPLKLMGNYEFSVKIFSQILTKSYLL